MKRIILTGERDRGKTSFCRLLAAEAISRGLDVTGILSLKEMEKNRVAALWASDCREEERRRLARFIPEAERAFPNRADSKTPSWSFFPEAFLWGNALIAGAPPADLFILDEAGPLEFSPESPQSDSAWTAGMERMDRGVDRIALAVVRPALVDRARLQWPDALVFVAPCYRAPRSETEEAVRGLLS
jgi:hypothetical protein